MGITEFLLKLATDEEFNRQFSGADDVAKQDLLREVGLSEEDQLLIAGRDLSGMRVKVSAEFDIEHGEKAATHTIYTMPGTIYIPPPPPPTEAS